MIRRVALVSPYDFAQNGGVTEHVVQLTRQLRQRNVDVTILAPSSQPNLAEPGLVSLGTVTPIPINGSIARTTISPAVVNDVGSLLARTRFDVIHLHEPLAPMLPLSVLNASSSPNVGTFHASGDRSLGYAASRKLLDWLAQRLTVRVAVSPAAARFARRYFPGDYQIIPNGVDTQRFNQAVAPLPQWRDGQPTILFVGRFEEPRKGFPILLEAFGLVQQQLPSARLVVVGRGDAAPFQAHAQAAGLQHVHFIGSVSAEDLPRYYRSADVLCAPSTGQESFGIILVEAMSSGCPIVASNIEGYARVVTHRREGLLVPPSNVEALAVALLQVLKDDTLQRQLAAAGPETAAQYAWQDVTDRILNVYERAQRMNAEGQRVLVSGGLLPMPFAQTSLTTQGSLLLASPIVRPPLVTSGQDTQGATFMLSEPFEARVRALTSTLR